MHSHTDEARQVLRFLRALDAAQSVRWEASPRPRPREDVVRSGSEVSDPTAAIALDEVRSSLSTLVRQCEDGLAHFAARCGPAAAQLEAAVARWEGQGT